MLWTQIFFWQKPTVEKALKVAYVPLPSLPRRSEESELVLFSRSHWNSLQEEMDSPFGNAIWPKRIWYRSYIRLCCRGANQNTTKCSLYHYTDEHSKRSLIYTVCGNWKHLGTYCTRCQFSKLIPKFELKYMIHKKSGEHSLIGVCSGRSGFCTATFFNPYRNGADSTQRDYYMIYEWWSFYKACISWKNITNVLGKQRFVEGYTWAVLHGPFLSGVLIIRMAVQLCIPRLEGLKFLLKYQIPFQR